MGIIMASRALGAHRPRLTRPHCYTEALATNGKHID